MSGFDEAKLKSFQNKCRARQARYDWQPMYIAFEQVRDFYTKAGFASDMAEQHAKTAIIRRLSRAAAYGRINSDNAFNQYALDFYPGPNVKKKAPRRIALWDGKAAHIEGTVPYTFWRLLVRSGMSDKCDWWAGDFEFAYFDENLGFDVVAKAFGVEISICKLPGFVARDGKLSVPLRLKRKASISPVSEAALLAWWKNLDPATKALPHATLVDLGKAAFPSKLVSRDRIRALDPGRKRGPKPISGKAPA